MHLKFTWFFSARNLHAPLIKPRFRHFNLMMFPPTHSLRTPSTTLTEPRCLQNIFSCLFVSNRLSLITNIYLKNWIWWKTSLIWNSTAELQLWREILAPSCSGPISSRTTSPVSPRFQWRFRKPHCSDITL